MRLEDLPPNVRKQVEQELGARPKRQRAEVTDGGLPIRCGVCGEVFATYNGKRGWEGHAEERGHHRAELVLD